MRIASPEVIADIRKNIGHIGYPGGCPTCMFDGTYGHNGHRGPQGPDTITCVGCHQEGKSAFHNHVICKECEGEA